MTHPGDLLSDIQRASAGAGDLLQRDYWAAIESCVHTPSALLDDLGRRFCEFPPPDLVSFRRVGDCDRPLEVGDEMDIAIRMTAECRVRVVCRDEQSITLATLRGHPEAGRITFGAYRHESGVVIFHIRSRSRSGNALFAAGFAAFGEAMQTNTWADFVATVANTYGAGVQGDTHVETQQVEPQADDDGACTPTFEARGSNRWLPPC